MIGAAIFDMDGLLVDSEPHWRSAEMEIFRTVGLELTEEMCKRTTGMPIGTVVEYWYERQPWSNRSCEEVAHEIHAKASEYIGSLAGPMPGMLDTLAFFRDHNIPMAIASASPMDLIELVIDRLNIREFFVVWHSATLEARNKPHPDVYLGTARKLGVEPACCVAFEDSGNGLKSAHAAGMITVAVPADYEFEDPKFDLATIKIPSLSAVNEQLLAVLQAEVNSTLP